MLLIGNLAEEIKHVFSGRKTLNVVMSQKIQPVLGTSDWRDLMRGLKQKLSNCVINFEFSIFQWDHETTFGLFELPIFSNQLKRNSQSTNQVQVWGFPLRVCRKKLGL